MSAGKDKMSVLQLTVLTTVGMMGSGIVMLPTKLAQVGTISILSWLITAVGSMCLAYAFAKCGMFTRRRGGMGGYAQYSFGKAGSFMANYTYGVSLLIANIAIAISAVGYAQEFLGIRMEAHWVWLSTVLVLWAATMLNFGGAKYTGHLFSAMACGALIPVGALFLFGWYWFDPKMYISAWNPHNLSFFDGVSQSIAMTLWAFLGLESACVNSDAVENPERNVPKAVMGGTLGAAAIYILSTNVIAGIVPNAELAQSNAPFGLAFATMFNETVGQIVMGMMIVSCFGSLLSWQFTIGNVFRTSAEEGYFPRFFSWVTTYQTPIVGMAVIVTVQSLLSLMTVGDSLYEQFETMVNLAVVTNVVPYLLSMGSVVVIQKAAKSYRKRTTRIALIGALYSFYALYSSGPEAMMYGALVTFFGWTLYGFVSARFDLESAVAWNEEVDAKKRDMKRIGTNSEGSP